jgi:hypothetical protein
VSIVDYADPYRNRRLHQRGIHSHEEAGTMTKPRRAFPTREEFMVRAFAIWQHQRLIEAAEASVALSHPADCDCSVCARVKERNKREEAHR